ncbi:MAG: glycosyltransferase family 2 protein, partial [Thermoanaerobaculia bacterium]
MTTPRIDLLWLGSTECPEWGLGAAEACRAEPSAVAAAVDDVVEKGRSEAVLMWDSELELPDPEKISRAVERPGDLWHAGLALGMGGLPGLLDYVSPTWMLSADPSIEREATSWRVSMRACLIRSEVVRQLGGPEGDFDSIAGCSLELGHRYALSGALPRHLPWLIEDRQQIDSQVLPIEDEVRFLGLQVGKFWSRWAMLRALLDGRIPPRDLRRLAELNKLSLSGGRKPRNLTRTPGSGDVESGSVSVLIPTLNRYEYLETLLGQIAKQTVQPSQVIVVDQTAPARRRSDLRMEHPNLPLEVMYREEPGQCSSRNAGLQAATGKYILFLDDDDEIPEDLIERHLKALAEFSADVSSGVADEAGAGPLPPDFEVFRVSDVFPTNNTLARRSALE